MSLSSISTDELSGSLLDNVCVCLVSLASPLDGYCSVPEHIIITCPQGTRCQLVAAKLVLVSFPQLIPFECPA